MDDRLPNPATDAEPGRGSPPRLPRWLKLSGIIAGVLVLAAVAVMFIAGGDHGPGRHTPGGDAPAEDNGDHRPFGH